MLIHGAIGLQVDGVLRIVARWSGTWVLCWTLGVVFHVHQLGLSFTALTRLGHDNAGISVSSWSSE